MQEATPTEREIDMIKAIIDRFEGEYAVAEISCTEKIFFIDILCENFVSLPCQGDMIAIESIDDTMLSCENSALSESVLGLLDQLNKPVKCIIKICSDETVKRKERIDALASELFED